MKFYFETLKKIRKEKKIRADALAANVEVVRSTLWSWENGKIVPSEEKVRQLARALNVDVGKISDLGSEAPVSDSPYPEQVNSFLRSFASTDLKEREKLQNHYLVTIKEQFDELNQIGTIARVFLQNLNIIFYAKGVSLEYIIANRAFSDNVSLKHGFRVYNHKDADFFSEIEAKQNTEEDKQVILSGKALHREGFIPGSRKKKWGMISKIPFFDSSKKVAGVMGYFIDITVRRKNEILIQKFVKGISMLDETLWMAQKARTSSDGSVCFDDFLFLANTDFKKLITDNKDISYKELHEMINSRTLDTKYRKKLNLDLLKKNKYGMSRGEISLPNKTKVKTTNKTFYDPEMDLYIGALKKDTDEEKTERIIKNLRELGVDDKIIKKAFAEEQYSPEIFQFKRIN